jgi:hypothetical protein
MQFRSWRLFHIGTLHFRFHHSVRLPSASARRFIILVASIPTFVKADSAPSNFEFRLFAFLEHLLAELTMRSGAIARRRV